MIDFFKKLFAGMVANLMMFSPLVGTESMSNHTSQILKIVQIGDPVLRQKARPLEREEILSPYIQNLIQDMTTTMRAAPGVGLAAPQIGVPIQLAVIEDRQEYHTSLTAKQLQERNRSPVPWHVVINPKIYLSELNIDVEDVYTPAEFFEGCLSIDGLYGLVPRATCIRVECLNEHAEPVVIRAEGWYARILQHEVDHLNGVLYIDHACSTTLTSKENFAKYWKDQPMEKSKSSSVCPCGTGRCYSHCCQPFHRGGETPADALALMRSRYSAYAYGCCDYIMRTTDPDNVYYQADSTLWAQQITERCQNTIFKKLDILEFHNGSEEAFVTFKAHYLQNGRNGCLFEKSRFRKVGAQWLYLEGILILEPSCK